MTKKTRTQRTRPDGAPPPPASAQKARLAEMRRATARERRPVPQRRLIATLAVLFLGTACGTLFLLWLPSHTLVHDLRTRGVATWAQVTSSPRDKFGSAGNVEVRFTASGRTVETVLSDWGGERPGGLEPGGTVSVTYDRQNPHRVLTTAWVQHPPAVTAPMLWGLVLSPFFLAGTVLLAVLRHRRLRDRRPQVGATTPPAPRKEHS
ncbi:DUF3592 domain-containing protein [Streptomyces sp. NPDC002265]|uniref:DUF3592 domain-containing protein n=1 Tax=Streptomyces sp. NPDC002265 TaxID=3154415 RepID=UPI00331E5B89